MTIHTISRRTAEKLEIHDFHRDFKSTYKEPCLKSVLESLLFARGYIAHIVADNPYLLYPPMAQRSIEEAVGTLQDLIDSLENQQRLQSRLVGKREPQQAMNYCSQARAEANQRISRKQAEGD